MRRQSKESDKPMGFWVPSRKSLLYQHLCRICDPSRNPYSDPAFHTRNPYSDPAFGLDNLYLA